MPTTLAWRMEANLAANPDRCLLQHSCTAAFGVPMREAEGLLRVWLSNVPCRRSPLRPKHRHEQPSSDFSSHLVRETTRQRRSSPLCRTGRQIHQSQTASRVYEIAELGKKGIATAKMMLYWYEEALQRSSPKAGCQSFRLVRMTRERPAKTVRVPHRMRRISRLNSLPSWMMSV